MNRAREQDWPEVARIYYHYLVSIAAPFSCVRFMPLWLRTLLAVLLVCAVPLAATMLLAQNAALVKRQLPNLLSFGVGVLFASAGLHLIPEAVEHHGLVAAALLTGVGFVTFYTIERLLAGHDHDHVHGLAMGAPHAAHPPHPAHAPRASRSILPIAFGADALHNFTDEFAKAFIRRTIASGAPRAPRGLQPDDASTRRMKEGIHPPYHPGQGRLTRSTMTSEQKIRSTTATSIRSSCSKSRADSHPFYTGTQRLIDTQGRVDKFKKRYGGRLAHRPPWSFHAPAPSTAAAWRRARQRHAASASRYPRAAAPTVSLR
jgi:large subunit ribosomal protein L31